MMPGKEPLLVIDVFCGVLLLVQAVNCKQYPPIYTCTSVDWRAW